MLNYIIIGLVVVFFVYRIMPVKGIENITPLVLKEKLAKKQKEIQYVDVRTPGEYRANRIKEFKNIPLQELTKRSNELNKEQEVVVICQSGMRSNNAAKQLKKQGFKHITNVRGGMSAWS